MRPKGPFAISEKWAQYHRRNARTDSQTLPLAAFPSLPLGHCRVSPTGSSNHCNTFVDIEPSDSEATDCEELIAVHPPTFKAIQYRFGHHLPGDNLAVEDAIWAERNRLYNAGLLPIHLNLKQEEAQLCPKSLNSQLLIAKHKKLSARKKMLILHLSELGHVGSKLQASVLATVASILPEKLTSIRAYWQNVRDLKWLVLRLRIMLGSSRMIRSAEKHDITPQQRCKAPTRKPWPAPLAPEKRKNCRHAGAALRPITLSPVHRRKHVPVLHSLPLKGSFSGAKEDFETPNEGSDIEEVEKAGTMGSTVEWDHLGDAFADAWGLHAGAMDLFDGDGDEEKVLRRMKLGKGRESRNQVA